MSTKGEHTRNEIIGAARSLFYHRGYSQTSFTDIVDRTGISRGNINHYFRTKDEILQAVIKQHVSNYKALLSEWDKKFPEPKDRLHRFVQMVGSNKNNLSRYGCPIGTLNAELGKEPCEFQDAARRLFDVFIDWLTLQFRKLDNPARAQAHALHLLGRTEGVSVIAHVYKDPKLVTREVASIQKWVDEF